jgi:dTDP-4-dehydrorhamnose reductase
MNVLILGKGYIGAYLQQYLNNKNLSNYNIFFKSKKDLDYTDSEILYNFCLTENINTIVNASGYTGSPNVDGCEDNKNDCFFYNVNIPVIIESVSKSLDINFIHIGSGCIYTGYDKEYNEDDTPNFGIFNKESSFYSKTKHISELMLDSNFTNIIRIRMPIENKLSRKNLLTKLINYSNLIDFVNSKTDMQVLCEFIETVIENFKAGIYNAVHSNSLGTEEVIDILKEYGIENKDWKFIPYENLELKCNRSNCTLTNDKIKNDFNFDFGNEEHYLRLNASLIGKELKWKKN